MKITLADKSIAWLALLSGLTISAVAIWYSVAGLVSIFAAATIPIIVMGVVLEVSKLIATVWLKINWSRAPVFIRTYLLIAIAILMLITSMGIFGFLSKAHSDAGLVSGDVQAKIAVYDEKIKTERENIDAARKALTQMDAQVNERLSRSTDDRGAERAVQIRRQQQAERTKLQNDISRSQSAITKLNEERAPIAAEVRKVEAEVGPIKYIANFIYGDNPDANILEKAVTWVIIIIVAVFDPLAVILLLASQYSFQWFRKAQEEEEHDYMEQHFQEVADELNEVFKDDLSNGYVAHVGEKPTADELKDDFLPTYEEITPKEEKSIFDQHPYLNQPFSHFKDLKPIVHKPEPVVEENTNPLDQWNKMIEAAEEEVAKEKTPEEIVNEGLNEPFPYPEHPSKGDRTTREIDGVMRNLIFNGSMWINADSSDQDAVRELEESKKKSSYMIREEGKLVVKTKE
jgi:hypothetical protein